MGFSRRSCWLSDGKRPLWAWGCPRSTMGRDRLIDMTQGKWKLLEVRSWVLKRNNHVTVGKQIHTDRAGGAVAPRWWDSWTATGDSHEGPRAPKKHSSDTAIGGPWAGGTLQTLDYDIWVQSLDMKMDGQQFATCSELVLESLRRLHHLTSETILLVSS